MVTAFEASTVPTLQLPVCRAAAQHGASRSSTQCHRAAIEALAGLTSHLEAPGGKSASELIFVGRMVPISLLAMNQRIFSGPEDHLHLAMWPPPLPKQQ